jgi:hypothetical protein
MLACLTSPRFTVADKTTQSFLFKFVDRFTALRITTTGASLATRRIRILPMNQGAWWPITFVAASGAPAAVKRRAVEPVNKVKSSLYLLGRCWRQVVMCRLLVCWVFWEYESVWPKVMPRSPVSPVWALAWCKTKQQRLCVSPKTLVPTNQVSVILQRCCLYVRRWLHWTAPDSNCVARELTIRFRESVLTGTFLDTMKPFQISDLEWLKRTSSKVPRIYLFVVYLNALSVTYTLCEIYDQVIENEMGRACRNHERTEECIQAFGGEARRKETTRKT